MTKVKVFFYDAEPEETEIKNYNAEKITEMLNDTTKAKVTIGDIITDRGNVKRVVPVKEDK